MTAHTMEEAIEALRKLPRERQEELAAYIYELATTSTDPEDISAADLPAVLEGLAQAERGEFAPTQQVEDVFRRFGK